MMSTAGTFVEAEMFNKEHVLRIVNGGHSTEPAAHPVESGRTV